MRQNYSIQRVLMLLALVLAGILPAHAGDTTTTKSAATMSQAQMTVSLQVLGENKRMPEVKHEDVIVTQGSERLKVTDWKPAGALDLFILIDDSAETSLGSQLGDLRTFINSQAPATSVGVGYMRNGTVQIAQNFTRDHNQAAKALRLPMASNGAFGSPYLSLIDLMKRWPENSSRREVVMITDGIDRFHGGPRYRGFTYMSPDVSSASTVAQRTGTIVHSIFTRGVGRWGHNFWEITNGQNSIARLSDETGGQSYFLGTQNAVSFRPYLDDLQKTLDNQYVLEFNTIKGQKSGLQYVRLNTEVAGVELSSADSVWVEAR